jgi:glyoxylase-like metal-dependent hydrolase (beta-lactamase superfamily II)
MRGSLFLFFACSLSAQVPIKAVPVASNVFMVSGSGGNIGLHVGTDGIFMIDSQYAPASSTILKQIREISQEPIRYLFNTHWHGDHVGGNENFKKTGGAIVAHANVRVRMEKGQTMEIVKREVPPAPKLALPTISFDGEITFNMNDEVIHAFHCKNGHTDGDAVVHFKNADVFHMGDLFFNGMYPFIDLGSGGSIDGLIAAADRILLLATDQSKIIPGHGPLATREDLSRYREMLVSVRKSVLQLVEAGNDTEAIVAKKPTAELDETWGGGFMKRD